MDYQIVSQMAVREPKRGAFYLDDDGDLFLYMGDGAEDGSDPWIELSSSGAFDRAYNHPKEPLTEVERNQYVRVIDGKINRWQD